jgi:hypothetical protein
MLVLAVAFNLGAAPPSAAADESVLGLDGAWRLDRTENFEPYLKKSGASWWKRKLAKLGSSRMRQTISQEGQQFEITGENPVETRTEKFVADGVTELSAETATGEMMTWTAHVEGAALVIDGQGELGHRIVRREIVDDGMVMTIFNPDADTQCKLYFERAESD